MAKDYNYYFEFSDYVLSMKLAPAKYCTYRGKNLDRVREYTWNAERIWFEGDTGVFYVKYRTAAPQSEKVDAKEFMWIKLSAQDIK